MGILDKIKALFKKKPKAEAAGAAPAKPGAAAKVSVKDYGSTPLGKALTFAETKLAEKQDNLTNAEVEMFRSKISSYAEHVGKDEEDALVSVSQLIGGITRA